MRAFFLNIAGAAHRRGFWLLTALCCGVLLMLAHRVFQHALFMKPCEHCVYIRFAFAVIGAGALIAAAAPRLAVFRLTGWLLGVAGSLYGLWRSLELRQIHRALRSDDPMAVFGLQGCSLEPAYPFNLPLHHWWPDWFLPTGDCGYDLPEVPADAVLAPWAQYLVDLYTAAGGWYLFPSLHFMNMAECCLLAFGFTLVLYLSQTPRLLARR